MSGKLSNDWNYSLSSALLLMAPFDLLASLAMDVYLPAIPKMPEALNTSPLVIQLTLSLYMVTLGLGQLFFGPLSDRTGRRKVVLIGALLFTISSFVLVFTSNGYLFLGARVFQALGSSAALVATFATVRDVYADKPEGNVIYSLFSSILAFVPALGPILGAILAYLYGWRMIFIFLGGIGLMAFIHALLRWRETKPSSVTKENISVPVIFKSMSFWIYTLGFSTAMGSFFVFFSTAPRVLMEKVGLSQMHFSFVFASVAIVMIVVSHFAKSFVTKWGTKGSLIRGLIIILMGSIILTGCNNLMDLSIASFVLPMWVIAVGMIFIVSVTANGALEEFPHMAGTAVAFYYCLQSLIVSVVGTAVTLLLPGDSAWPLIAFTSVLPVCTFMLMGVEYLMRKSI